MVLHSEDCLRQMMAIHGALGAILVDYTSGLMIRSAGRTPGGDYQMTTAGITDMVRVALSSAAFASVGRPGTIDDIVVTAGNGYHLVHFIAGRTDSPLALYLWLDRQNGNLAMSQRRLRTAAAELVAG